MPREEKQKICVLEPEWGGGLPDDVPDMPPVQRVPSYREVVRELKEYVTFDLAPTTVAPPARRLSSLPALPALPSPPASSTRPTPPALPIDQFAKHVDESEFHILSSTEWEQYVAVRALATVVIGTASLEERHKAEDALRALLASHPTP